MFIYKKSSTFAVRNDLFLLGVKFINLIDMKHTIYLTLCGFILSILCTCCKPKVTIGDVDLTTQVETSLSLPIGCVSLKLGDFLGESTIQGITVDGAGQYVFKDTMHFTHKLSLIDIEDYLSPAKYTLNIAEEISQAYPEFTNLEIPKGKTLKLNFPINISLDKMNANAENQRFDSVVIDFARVITSIKTENFHLTNKDIKNIELEIKNGFKCATGNKITLPFTSYGLGEEMPVDLEDVHLVFMKDPKDDPSAKNLLDSIFINVQVEIQTSQAITLQNNSLFTFTLKLDSFEYDAIFGYIKMPNLLQDSILNRSILSFWPGWKAFDGTILPITKPSILFTINHGFSVPLTATVNSLNVLSENGESRYASFNGSHSKTFTFPNKIAMDAPYNATTTDSLRIDYQEMNGNIDELFTIHPDYISYDYQIGIDSTSNQKQFRITNKTDLNMELDIHIPFEFNKNVHFSYCDTIHEVDLTTFQLDSLLMEAEFVQDVEKAEIKLYLDVENWIPFNIESQVEFYTKEDNLIQLSSMEEDHISLILQQPIEIIDGIVEKPSTNQIILAVNKSDFENIASTEYIVLKAKLKDNNTIVRLTPEAAVTIKAGITADIKAIINPNDIL